jgi:hypothetical protein
VHTKVSESPQLVTDGTIVIFAVCTSPQTPAQSQFQLFFTDLLSLHVCKTVEQELYEELLVALFVAFFSAD